MPTASHGLANADHDEKGAAQEEHAQNEVKDLGWNSQPSKVPNLVGGLSNEELWTLIRRFNKQLYHVKSVPEPPPGNLDLNIADEEEFSPDKLRASIERLYMTVIFGVVGLWKHIARLRSWRERNRTVAFAAVYFLAWAIDFLVPVLVAFAMILIVYPPARTYCFPPAPIALIDSRTGGVKKPAAGVLGSDNSLTGAPEKHDGEAVEQEASNFVSGFTSIAISSAAGKHPQGDPDGTHASSLEERAPDPTDVAIGISDAKDKPTSAQPDAVHDKTKQPMTAAMWSKTRPVMHVIANIADGWERFGNALSPTAPFPRTATRLKLVAVLAPIFLVSLVTSPYMFIKMNGLFVGIGFFADPLISRAASYLDRKLPQWKKPLDLRNSLLKGVPTNAQLTITLLRIGEANNAPLPPPPSSSPPPPEVAHDTAGQDLEHLGVPDDEMAAAIHPDDGSTSSTSTHNVAKSKKRHGRHLLATLKGLTKGGIETALGTDRLKAAAGAEHARNRLGVLRTNPVPSSGPIAFAARYRGRRGAAWITSTEQSPALTWTAEKDEEPVWATAIEDIAEIKKVGGLGWKSKLVVGWVMEREIADGLVVVDKTGNRMHLTAMALRDELFNRLVAMGSQMWESW